MLTASALTACGGGSSSPSGTGESSGSTAAAADSGSSGTTAAADSASSETGSKNLVCYWWGNQVRNERTAAALELYEQNNPGVSIDPQFADWSGYWDKLATLAAGNSMPDILQMDYMYVDQYAKSGLLVDLTPYSEYFMRSFDIVPFGDKKMNGTAEDWIPFFDQYVLGLDEGWLIDPGIFAEISLGSIEQQPLVYGTSPDTRSWCSFANSNQLAASINVAPEGMELAITTWPAYDPVKSDYLKSAMFFSIGAGSANEEEAVKVLNFLLNDIDANKIMATK